jgi:hypothetical protein
MKSAGVPVFEPPGCLTNVCGLRPAGLVHARDELSESRRELETGGRSQLAKRVGMRPGARYKSYNP